MDVLTSKSRGKRKIKSTTLFLTLKKLQFEVTSSGEKNIEYRKAGKWILSRLINKDYEYVKFTNGYGQDRPYFICEFKGWSYAKPGVFNFSNGLVVNVDERYVEISLGNIITVKNI